MKDIFQLWEGLLDAETCQQIIDVATEKPPTPAAVGINGTIAPDYRDSDIRFLDRMTPYPDGQGRQWGGLYEFIEHHTRWANHTSFGADISFFQAIQMATYREERQSHFKWHRDTFWVNPHETGHRKLTCVIQLSDPADYDGGQLELDVDQQPEPAMLAKRGSLIVFPAFVWHRVKPVTRGTRHSLVCWACGPAWR